MAITPTGYRRAAVAVVGTAVAFAALPTVAAATPAPTASKVSATAAQDRAKHKRAKRVAQRERANRARASLVRVALNQKGERYVAGAAGPNRFDCSGFTMYVYKKATGKYLPHFSGAQMRKAKRVRRKHLKPGDLLFFGPGGSQHVSMYIGKGKMIHATNPRSGVRIDSINMGYYKARYAGAGRIIQG